MKIRLLLPVAIACSLAALACSASAEADIAALKASAEKGSAEAQTQLGDAYQTGKGVPGDSAEALKQPPFFPPSGPAQRLPEERPAKSKFLAAIISLGSCTTTPIQSHTPSRLAPDQTVTVSDHWVKVRSNPPTWYPRGTRSDGPTDFRSGEWVVSI